MPKRTSARHTIIHNTLKCHLCGYAIPWELVDQKHTLFGTIDHVSGRALGGTDAASNRAPTHRLCNQIRNTQPITNVLMDACRVEVLKVFEANPHYAAGENLHRRLNKRKIKRLQAEMASAIADCDVFALSVLLYTSLYGGNQLIRFFGLAVLAGLGTSLLFGDVTYNEAVKYTGGTMLDMVHRMASMPMMGRMGGGGLKNAFRDENYTIYIKGAKMARLGGMFSSIYDLDAGTITSINNEKKTYTVQTFEELRQQMERMQERMNHGGAPTLNFDMKVEQTGQKRDINGQTATETLMTMTAKNSGNEGQMVVKVHTWLVPPDPAMNEAVDYSKRLAEKFQYAFAGFSPMLGGAGAGINAAMKEAMKQNGYPLLTDIEVSGVSAPMAAMMGGGNSDPNAPAIQMETQNSNFATGGVDDSKFSVPAGYKQETPKH